MQLSAVTVCVSYSAALAACHGNAVHFDRWIVVTVPDDVATQRWCAGAGVEYCVCFETQAGGFFFAAHHKGYFINTGLRQLRRSASQKRVASDDWLLVLDADTLMLSDFCERLEALSPFLDRNKLYGLRGRRIAASPEVFTALRRLEPWESALERFSMVVGCFNLFHRNGPHRSYPKSDPDGTIHDDYRFYSLVGKANCAELPMTALHLGQTRVNWNGNGREEDVTVHSEAWAQAARDDAWAVNDAASAMASTTHELKTRV